MNFDTLPALGAQFRQAWQQSSPSEWSVLARRTFSTALAWALCLTVWALADVPGGLAALARA